MAGSAWNRSDESGNRNDSEIFCGRQAWESEGLELQSVRAALIEAEKSLETKGCSESTVDKSGSRSGDPDKSLLIEEKIIKYKS